MATTEYAIDGGAWQAYSGPFAVAGFGAHTVAYRSTDAVGNVETPKQMTFQIAAFTDVPGTVGGDVPGALALSLGSPSSNLGTFTPGVARDYGTTLSRERGLDGRHGDADRARPELRGDRAAGQRRVRAA